MKKLAPDIGPCINRVTVTIRLWLTILILLVLFPSLAQAVRIFPTYNIVDLGVLPGGDRSYAYGINNNNEVVGESSVPSHAFLYSYKDGTMIDLGTLGGSSSGARAINDSGQIVGWSLTGPYPFVDHAFLYSGSMIDLGVLPGADASVAFAINKSGLITGMSMVPPSGEGFFPYHAFLSTGVPPPTDLGITSTPGFEQTEGYAINDDGWVAGKTTPPGGGLGHALLYDGTMKDIGLELADYRFWSEAHGINNAGQVLVTAIPMDYLGSYAAIYKDGEWTMLASLGTSNKNGRALAINNRGDVVGKLANNRAFVYIPDNGLVELSSLVVGTNPFAQLNVANAINDLGYIAGTGTLPDGSERAFLAVPGPGKRIFGGHVPYLLLLD
jgi:probable HAF family extracellular repeat protein